MDKLALFDVDSTLVKSSKGHKAAFSEAFRKVYGVDTNIKVVNYHGMTDQQIIVEVLKKSGLAEKEIKTKLKRCMDVIVEYFEKNIEHDNIAATEGARELLEELDRLDVLMGLVTGNLEPIAMGKMKKAGLDSYLKVGGFGSDHIKRSELVRIAIKKAEEKFGFDFKDNVFLFGDTPNDVRAGKLAGVKTIAIATGIYPKDQLEKEQADFVLENLKDKNKIIKIIMA